VINCLQQDVPDVEVLIAVREHPPRWHQDENMGWEYIADNYVLAAVWPQPQEDGTGLWTWRTLWCGAHNSATTAEEGKANVMTTLAERIDE
jgi:hypothetical protein